MKITRENEICDKMKIKDKKSTKLKNRNKEQLDIAKGTDSNLQNKSSTSNAKFWEDLHVRRDEPGNRAHFLALTFDAVSQCCSHASLRKMDITPEVVAVIFFQTEKCLS